MSGGFVGKGNLVSRSGMLDACACGQRFVDCRGRWRGAGRTAFSIVQELFMRVKQWLGGDETHWFDGRFSALFYGNGMKWFVSRSPFYWIETVGSYVNKITCTGVWFAHCLYPATCQGIHYEVLRTNEQ